MKSKRVTADDVARASGVSRATVSFVLNSTPGQTITPDVRERVRQQASRLGYVPHAHAKALATGQSRLVLALLPDWPLEHLTRQMLDEASTVLDEAGYSLVTMDAVRSGHAAPLWETLRPDVVMPFQALAPVTLDAIRRSGSNVAMPDDLDHPSFDTGPELQIEHLIDLGHRSVAYVSTPVRGLRIMDEDRLNRTRAAAESAGLQFRSARVDDENAREIVSRWVAEGVTGVAAFNDESALRVLGAALREGMDVPGEVAIVGHDDWPIARLTVPSLTSIRIDAAGLGRYFAHRALAAARGSAAAIIVPPELQAHLMRREST